MHRNINTFTTGNTHLKYRKHRVHSAAHKLKIRSSRLVPTTAGTDLDSTDRAAIGGAKNSSASEPLKRPILSLWHSRGSTFCVFMFIDEREQRNPTRSLMAQLGIKPTDCTFKLPLYETETIMSDSSWCGSLCWAFLAAVQLMAQLGIKHTDCTFKLPLHETETIMSDSSWCGSLCWAFLAAVQLMAQLGIKHTDCTFKLPLHETETIMSDSSWCGGLCWAFLAAVQPVVLIGPTANNTDDGLAEYTGLLPFPGVSGHGQQGGNVHVSVQAQQIEE